MYTAFDKIKLFWFLDRCCCLGCCKNFNVAHYSKNIEDIHTKLAILAHHDKMQLQDKGHNSESCSFGVMSHFLIRMMASDRRALVLHAVLLFSYCPLLFFMLSYFDRLGIWLPVASAWEYFSFWILISVTE